MPFTKPPMPKLPRAPIQTPSLAAGDSLVAGASQLAQPSGATSLISSGSVGGLKAKAKTQKNTLLGGA